MSARFFNHKKMARKLLLASIFLSSMGFSTPKAATPNEALMLRRITEYWKDGDYATVKRQIIDFLEKNPDTALYDHLQAMLGDLYFQERNYRNALATYNLIANEEIKQKTFFNRLQAEFETRNYLTVAEMAETFLKENPGTNPRQLKVRYLLAEAFFREALKTDDLEQKAFYLKSAKPHYKILTQTKYSDRALFPLAEIHRLLREDERAVALYLTLSEKYPEHRERFLFQAAILQIKDNKKEALKTFQNVYEMGGKRSRLAAFNRLILLFQNENYQEFLSFYQQVIGLMPNEKVSLLQFYEGRSHYALGDYGQAITSLEAFVTSAKGRSKELKTSLLLLVNCARYMKDVELIERTWHTFKTSFPRDSEVPTVLMIHAQMCRENGNLNQAMNDLKILSAEYPGYEDSEGVMYDFALLLSQSDRWGEAREAFSSFLSKYPNTNKKTAAWRHLINCCIEELKDPAQKPTNDAKENFVRVLRQAIREDKVLNEKEKETYSLVIIKCLCELGRYEDAAPNLSQYIVDVKNPALLAEAHLLMAICEQKLNSDLEGFIRNAEKALHYNPKIPERSILHLELYNAYLSKSQVTDTQNKNHFIKQAADHLFYSESWKNRTIKMDNFLWLTSHYYQLAMRKNEDAYAKAKVLFQHLLGFEEGKEMLNISSDTLYLEAEAIKYAELLEIHNDTKQQIQILEQLARKQQDLKKLSWKHQRRTVLELGKAYEANKQYQDALNSYRHLTGSKEKVVSVVTNTAMLHQARLEYRLLKPTQRHGESPEVISILHTLKDLQIQKKIAAEPVHLEAALLYAEMRAQLAEQGSEAKNALFFYKRMAEDFNNAEDPITQEYNHQREKNTEKNAIYTSYMKYLDAQMLGIQAKVALEEQNTDKAVSYQEEAVSILNRLLENEYTLRPYLVERVKRAKVEITKQL